MPIYEYECDGCHEVFEVRQKLSDPAPTEHSCGSQKVRRILSATTFVLKGTGWYKTDYADKKTGEPKGQDGGGASAKTDGKDAASPAAAPKADAKPPAKADGNGSKSAKADTPTKAT